MKTYQQNLAQATPREAKALTSKKCRQFVVDIAAPLFKRACKLSKSAQGLYMTMRMLANAKTGELAIRGNPLNWLYIVKQARIGRYTWLRALRELKTFGYVTVERERFTVFRNGRRIQVLGPTHYFVHRQPKSDKKPLFHLESDSRTVRKSDPQISSETPKGTRSVLGSLDFQVLGSKGENTQSSSPAKMEDDTAFRESLIRKAHTILEKQYPDWKSWQVEAAIWTVMVHAHNSGTVPRSPHYFVAGVRNLSNLELNLIENCWTEESFRAWLAHTRKNLSGAMQRIEDITA